MAAQWLLVCQYIKFYFEIIIQKFPGYTMFIKLAEKNSLAC